MTSKRVWIQRAMAEHQVNRFWLPEKGKCCGGYFTLREILASRYLQTLTFERMRGLGWL